MIFIHIYFHTHKTSYKVGLVRKYKGIMSQINRLKKYTTLVNENK